MAIPIIPTLGALAVAYLLRDKIAGLFRKHPAVTPAGYVTELDQGQVYAGVAMMAPAGGTDPAIGSNHLAAYLTSVGFQIISQPVLRSSADATKFAAGQSAAWTFTAKWTKSARTVEGPGDPAIGMIQFVPIPAAL